MKIKPSSDLVLSIFGLLITGYFNIQYFLQGGGLAPTSFLAAVFANPLTTAITIGVYLNAVVFSLWMIQDSKIAGIQRAWLYILATFAIGLAFAWSLYFHHKKSRNLD